MMKPKIIKTEADYDDALSRIEELMEMEETSEVVEELELIATLVELYEAEVYPISSPDPIDAIRFRMEQQGLKQKDLIPFLGSKSRVSEVLSGKRSLSLTMIRSLHNGLGIPFDVLMGQNTDSLDKVAEAPSNYDTKRNHR